MVCSPNILRNFSKKKYKRKKSYEVLIIKMPFAYSRKRRASYASQYYRDSRAKRRRISVTKTLTRKRFTGLAYPGITQELKFKDHQRSDAVVPIGGAITSSIVLVGQGITESTRIGRKIAVRSMNLRFQISLPSGVDLADVPNGDTMRIIVFLDRQANGANAEVLDLLETATYNSNLNLANKGRFYIYRDKFITINRSVAVTDGTNTSTTPLVLREFNMYRKLNVAVEFDGTSGLISELTTNNIAFLYITSQGLAGITDQESRIRYDG